MPRRYSIVCVMLALAAAAPAAAQSRPEQVCSSADGAGTKRATLPAGYTLELTRSKTAAIGSACSAIVRDKNRKTVWKADGYGALLDAWTGHDVDGDGHPDAVLAVDTGGGNRCCWTYRIVSFRPAFRVVSELPLAPFFKTDSEGRTLIYGFESFYDLGPNMAEAPNVVQVSRLSGGRLQDVTSAHCDDILEGKTDDFSTRRRDWAAATPALLAASRGATTVSSDVR